MPLFKRHDCEQPLPGPGLYRCADLGPDVRLCLVAIPEMLTRYLPSVAPGRCNTARPIVFDSASFYGHFLGEDEIDQVNRFKTLKKQVEWAGGRFALKTLVSATIPAAADPSEIAVAYESRGAPCLVTKPAISISISHSGAYALAGISNTAGTRIGLDIEQMNRQGLEAVKKVAFTGREIALAGNSLKAAFRIWTAKEAYLKFVKTGFRENLKRVDVSGAAIVHGGVVLNGLDVKTIRIGQRYLMSLVYNRD